MVAGKPLVDYSSALLALALLPLLPESLSAVEHRLRTDDTLLGLRVTGDQISIVDLSMAGGENWIEVPSKVPLIDHVVTNDKRCPVTWRLDDVKLLSEAQSTQISILMAGEQCALGLRSTWLAHPGPGPIEHTLAITNGGESTVVIPHMPSLALTLQPPRPGALTHWWVEKGAGKPGRQGLHTQNMGDGFAYQGVSSSYSKKALEPIPWQCIHDPSGPCGLYSGIESSGCVTQSASFSAGPSAAVHLGLGIDQTDAPFQARLQPGETYVFPTAFIGCYQGDVDEGCNRLHRWIERWLLPPSSDDRLPLLVSNTWGSGMHIDDPVARRMIDDCARLGIEMFHVDAGWFRAVGWWREDPRKFPNGLRAIADYAHQQGLKFGLWVAWTQGGHTTVDHEALSAFEPAMRGWFRYDVASDWQNSPWTGEPVCLASVEAQHWCTEELRRIIRAYDLDMLEHDQKMVVWDCRRDTHGHTACAGDISHRAALGYCTVYDALRGEFPDLLFENCVSGGRMVDFGVLRRCHYVCATDAYDPVALRQAFHDASYPLPPRAIEAYIANHPGPTLDTFRYMLRSGMMGWCTLMLDVSKWSPAQQETAKREFDRYKKRIRPQIRDGNIYHVLPRPSANGWDGIQYHTITTDTGVLFVFRSQSDQDRIAVPLKGLRPEVSYEVSYVDESSPPLAAQGKDLMTAGLPVILKSRESSEIVLISRSPALPERAAGYRDNTSTKEGNGD